MATTLQTISSLPCPTPARSASTGPATRRTSRSPLCSTRYCEISRPACRAAAPSSPSNPEETIMAKTHLLKLSSAAVALAAFATPAFAADETPAAATTAQTGTPPANEPPASTAVGGSARGQAPAVDANGDVITVTARRTEENLHDV